MGEDCVTKRPIRRRAHEEQPSYWPAVRKITANNGANIKKPLKLTPLNCYAVYHAT